MNQQPEMTTIEEIVENQLLKLKDALRKDFIKLYKKEYTTDWQAQRFIRNIEIGVMSLENTTNLFNKTLKDYGDAVRGETLNDVEEALKQWWGKDLEEGHAYADDYIAEGTTLSGDIIPVIRSLKGNNE